MTFRLQKAERGTTSVLIGVAGASGSGKTYSAIVLANSLAYPNMDPAAILATIEREGRSRVAVIDTEGGRALHYAPKPGEAPDFTNNFPFDHGEIRPPFTPQAYEDAVVEVDEAGYAVIVVDSMSHEYESEGGVLEWADKLAEGVPKPGIENPRTYGSDWYKDWEVKPVKSPSNWIKPKSAHKKMVNRMLQCKAHLVFCLRAEEKIELKKNGNRVEVIPAADRPVQERWVPICEKRFMFEMTVSFVLVPDNPGVPIPIKIQEQHRQCFPEGQQVNPSTGWSLADWASAADQAAAGNSPPPPPPPPPGAGDPGAAETGPEEASGPPADSAPPEVVVWVDKYLPQVDALTHLDGLIELQDKSQKRLASIKQKFPAQWDRILAAHASAQERLGVNQGD